MSRLERRDKNKGEPDHAASPLQQEQKKLKVVKALKRFGAQRPK